MEESCELLLVCRQVVVQISSFKSPLVSRKHLPEAELVCGLFKLLWIGWGRQRKEGLPSLPSGNLIIITHGVNAYPGSIHMWPACIHPRRSCCPCPGHNLSTPWPRSRTRSVSGLVWSKTWVRLWWSGHLRWCRSGPQFSYVVKKKEKKWMTPLFKSLLRM